MKQTLKRVVRVFLPEYQLNRIYRLDLGQRGSGDPSGSGGGFDIRTIESADVVTGTHDHLMRDHAWYGREHAIGYGIWEAGELVCITWFWTGDHPSTPSRFGTLASDEAVMVDLLTSARCRGKGYALAITRFAAMDLANRGYRRLWTWVWRNNWPSIRVFNKAGWTYAYFLVEFRPVIFQRMIRLRFLRHD